MLKPLRFATAFGPVTATKYMELFVQVWCPMCEYLGLSAVKAELEDICFAVLEPVRFQKVHKDRARLLAGELSPKTEVWCSCSQRCQKPR